MADFNINVGANTRRAERDIQKLVNRNYNINLSTRGSAPLGRITGQVNEFTKSLDASNARVIAFGASAGIIFGVQRAFGALASSVLETQKALTDINVILNISSSQLQKFGGELFNIAKNTGQSFQEVATAATEFSRQGLGVAETLKRTNEALILSRLSGLDTAKSVQALTAAVNSFASQAVTATEVVNKFANVDAAFAVSSADLAEALSRVGSSAAQSGVDLNELIAIVTAAQQTTARGGAVIGNSFKTIFTRLQRGKVVDLLENLGVNTTDSSGEIKSTINLLTDLAKVYDQLGTLQQAEVAEKVGGVFQINILKAALSDLGKEFSIYNSALQIAGSTTDQAIRRNEELNKTYSAQINALRENAKQLGASAGDRLFAPSFNRVVGNTNDILGSVNAGDGNSIGATLGKGILDGLGQVIAGPGLALLGGIFVKLFADLSKFAGGSLKELLSLNNASKQQQGLQQSISAILQKNPDLFKLMQQGTVGLNKGAEILLNNLRSQTIELQKQESIAAKIASQFLKSGGVTMVGGMPTATTATTGKSPKGKSSGFIPNFAVSQTQSIGETVGALKGGYKPGNVVKIKGMVANDAEEFIKYPGVSKPEIRPPEGSKAGEEHRKNLKKKFGFVPGEGNAIGFIPNFAKDSNYVDQKRFAAGKVFDNALALSLRLKSAYVEDRDTIDFPPNILSAGSVDKKVKEALGISSRTLYGDAKLSAKEGNQASFISKIIRIGGNISSKDSAGNYTVTPPGSGGSILIPGQDGERDYYITARAGVGAILKKNPSLEQTFNRKGMEKGSSVMIPKVLVDSVRNITGKQVFGAITKDPVSGKKQDFTKFETRAGAANRISSKFNKGFASGFIPNFAKASKAETVNLGDISSNRSYSQKLLSVIIPQPSKNLLKFGAQAKYGDKLYTTTGLPVSGPNPDVTKKLSQQNIPRLHKNIGQVVLDQANVFGQSLGATKFMSSVSELPNMGGVNSAAGIAFEGGVANALGKSVGSKNARVDFSSASLNPNIRNIFNKAPGSYEAKNRPSQPLINDGFLKFLSRVRPGAANLKTTAGIAQRTARIEELTKQGLSRKDRNRILKKEGLAAAGYIPNFAAEQIADVMALENSMAPAGEKAKFYKKPYPHVRYQSTYGEAMADHGGKKQALKDSLTGQKKAGIIKASGFIPNFAVNESPAPTDLSATIGALTTQLGGLAFMLSFSTGQYKKSLSELTQSTRLAAKEQLKVAREQIRKTYTAGSPEYIRAQENANRQFRQQAVPIQAKGQAALGVNALALTFIGPIIAETIGNAIGKETKEARVGSAGASAAGQAATFAGFGALLTAANPLVGGGIGLAAGAMLGLVDVIKQANTNIPELSEASKKASENLTKINDAGQKVQTQFEQVQQLRESGQGEKAGKLEADLLKLIGKDFRDNPELVSRVSGAVINKDVQSLVKALEESTRATLEKKGVEDLKLLIGEFSERSRPKELGSQFLDIFDISATNTPTEQINQLLDIIPKENLDVGRIKSEERAAYSGYAADTSEFDKAQSVGREIENYIKNTEGFASLAEEEQNKLIASLRNAAFVGELVNQLRGPVSDIKTTAESIAANSAKNNPIIKSITEALSQAQAIYAKFATNAQGAVDLQLTGQKAIREASKGITESQGQRDRSILTSAGNPDAAKNVRIDTDVKKFNTEFSNALNLSFDSVISNVAAAAIQSGQKTLASFSEIGGGVGAQSRASTNIDAASTFAEAFKQQFNIENFKDLIGLSKDTDLENFEGFNVQSVLNEISSKLNIDQEDKEGKALLDKIRESLDQANQKLLDQKAILTQQLTVLANNEFAANFEELMTAITKSFGGMEAFRSFDNQFSLTDELDRALRSLYGLRNASGPKTDIESARALSSIVEELSKLAGSNIVTDRTGGMRTELAPVVDAIVKGRANDIERTIKSILSGRLSKTGQGEALSGAFLNEQIENLDINRQKEDGTFKTLQELIREVAVKTAEIQTRAELGVGDVNQALLDESFNRLPENLQKIFKEQGMGQFNSIEQIAAAQQIVHSQLLQEIIDVLTGMSNIEGQFGSNPTGTSFSQDAAGGGGLNPSGVGAASEVTSANVGQANLPGQDERAKSFNEGLSVFQDETFKGLDGLDKTRSKGVNEQAPLDLNSVLNTKVSDLNGIISTEINSDMLPDNSPENPLLPPKNMIDTGINDALDSSIKDVVRNNPDLQGVGNLIKTDMVSPETPTEETTPSAQSIIDEMNNKYFSSSSSSSKAKGKAKGYIPKKAANPSDPGYQTEKSNIRKGVGGAKPWHSPYMTEINGEPAYVHDGEMIVPNMGNTGETGVLTPDMQKALNLAEGYIPKGGELDESAIAAFISRFATKKYKGTNLRDGSEKFKNWFQTNENAVTGTSTVGGRTPENKLLTRGTGKGPGAARGLQNFIQYGPDIKGGIFDQFNVRDAAGFYSKEAPLSGKQIIGMNTDSLDRFSQKDFAIRRHEIGHAMQDTTAGAKSGEMFKGKLGKFFGSNPEKFGDWERVVMETQARIMEKRSITGGILDMSKDAQSYQKQFKELSLDPNATPELRAWAKGQAGTMNIMRAGAAFGDLADPISFLSNKAKSFGRQVNLGGNVSVSEAGKGMVDQFKNIPQLLQNPKMLKQLGGGLLKGGAVGIGTQYAGEKLIPKFDGKNSDGEMSYWEEFGNEMRSFGIATGSGAAAGAAGTGGAGTILGAVAGGATDVLGKLWRLGSSSVELAKLTFDEYGREDKLKAQQAELAKRPKKLAEQAKVRREEKLNTLKPTPKSGVSMPPMPTTLDFANAATRNKQQTQLNKQITTAQTRPTNPFKLIGGKGNAPATQIDTRTGTGTLVPRAEAVNPNRGISESTSYAQDPEVAAAIKTGNISAIEKATLKAREKAGKSFQTPGSDFARQYNFQQDLSKAIGGIATGGTQAEVDAYYKKKADGAGMSDRFITDYIEPRERDLIKREEQKLNPPERNFTEKGARGRLKDIFDGYDGLMRGNRSMAQTQAYQAKKQELQKLFNSGNFEGIYNAYDSLPKSDEPRGMRTPDGFIVAPPTPAPKPKYKNAEEARLAGRNVLKPAPVGAYTYSDRMGGGTVFNAPYINPEIPKAMAAANEAATMSSINQTLAISDFNSGRGPDPRSFLAELANGGVPIQDSIPEEKKKAKTYAQGLVNRSFLAELANGGVPIQDSIPGIGPVVIDKNTEYSAANAVARKGLSQGMYESRKMQNISAQGFSPNFAVKKADTQPSPNNFSIKLGDMVINSASAQNNPDLYGKDFGSELQSRIPDVIEQIRSDMDKKYGRVADLVSQNENMFVNKIPPKSRGNATLRT